MTLNFEATIHLNVFTGNNFTSRERTNPLSRATLTSPLLFDTVMPFSNSNRIHVETQVLIVGAGPVGLTLALDLGLRGVTPAEYKLKTDFSWFFTTH